MPGPQRSEQPRGPEQVDYAGEIVRQRHEAEFAPHLPQPPQEEVALIPPPLHRPEGMLDYQPVKLQADQVAQARKSCRAFSPCSDLVCDRYADLLRIRLKCGAPDRVNQRKVVTLLN